MLLKRCFTKVLFIDDKNARGTSRGDTRYDTKLKAVKPAAKIPRVSPASAQLHHPRVR